MSDERDMKIQTQVYEVLRETVEDLEDNYGISIDLQFSWDYYEPSEEEKGAVRRKNRELGRSRHPRNRG